MEHRLEREIAQRKEGNVLFNDSLNTNVTLYASSHRQDNTYCGLCYTFVEHRLKREIAQWKEGNVLFNDALNTFYLRLYGVRHMVEDHSDSERGKPASATWATLSD